jgi:hypothetical protein
MADEQEEIVKIKFASYRRYFSIFGGCFSIFIWNFIMFLFFATTLAMNWYL